MRIKILCVGKLKEEYLKQAEQEYLKRLTRYCKVEVVEVAEERAPESLSEAEQVQVLDREGKKLQRKLKERDYVIALSPEGQSMDSEEFAERLQALGCGGDSSVAFLMGGSLGLSEAVKSKADVCLSFSKLTFPHQLFRVILLEQLYRAFRIIHNEPYHK